MTITELKRRVFNQLFMTYGEANSDAREYDYDNKVIPLVNECLNLIANSTLSNRKAYYVLIEDYNKIHKLPKEVLSVLYVDTEVEGATFYNITSREIKFNKPGEYIVVCECLYPVIPDVDSDETNEVLDEIPESLLTIAVLYTVSKLLYDTDQIRAAQVRNEYEVALAGLDVDRQDIQEHFSISSRW